MPFVRNRRTVNDAVLRELRYPDVKPYLPPLQWTHYRNSGILPILRKIFNSLEKVPEMQSSDLGKSGILQELRGTTFGFPHLSFLRGYTEQERKIL